MSWTYSEYLKIDGLLGLQQPLSGGPETEGLEHDPDLWAIRSSL